jgi:hypothetical protein
VTIAICFENETKPIDTVCGRDAKLQELQMVHIVTTMSERVNKLAIANPLLQVFFRDDYVTVPL